jgi:hypothetical protein
LDRFRRNPECPRSIVAFNPLTHCNAEPVFVLYLDQAGRIVVWRAGENYVDVLRHLSAPMLRQIAAHI